MTSISLHPIDLPTDSAEETGSQDASLPLGDRTQRMNQPTEEAKTKEPSSLQLGDSRVPTYLESIDAAKEQLEEGNIEEAFDTAWDLYGRQWNRCHNHLLQDPQLQLLLSKIYLKRKEYSESIRYIEFALRHPQKDRLLRCEMKLCLLESYLFLEKEDQFMELSQELSENIQPSDEELELLAALLHLKASAIERGFVDCDLENQDPCLTMIDLIKSERIKNIKAQTQAKLYYHLAIFRKENFQTAPATEHLYQAISLVKNDPEFSLKIWHKIAQFEQEENNTQQALDATEKALELNPGSNQRAELILLQSKAYLALKEFEIAFECANQAIVDHEKNPHLLSRTQKKEIDQIRKSSFKKLLGELFTSLYTTPCMARLHQLQTLLKQADTPSFECDLISLAKHLLKTQLDSEIRYACYQILLEDLDGKRARQLILKILDKDRYLDDETKNKLQIDLEKTNKSIIESYNHKKNNLFIQLSDPQISEEEQLTVLNELLHCLFLIGTENELLDFLARMRASLQTKEVEALLHYIEAVHYLHTKQHPQLLTSAEKALELMEAESADFRDRVSGKATASTLTLDFSEIIPTARNRRQNLETLIKVAHEGKKSTSRKRRASLDPRSSKRMKMR